MPIAVHSTITWAGQTIVTLAHNPSGGKPLNGWPGTRLIQLDEADARELLTQLSRALATPPECIDCGSTLHTVDDPSCPVSNAGDDGAD